MAQFKVKGILSYPHLNSPRAIEAGKDPKYSASVLILKTDPQVATIQAIIEQEKLNGWPSGFPATGKVFMKESPDHPEYMVINGNAKAEDKPAVVDMNRAPVMDPSLACAGSICWVAFNSFTYDQAVNKGVSCGLNAVMVTGEMGALGRLDGRPSVESMFADVAEGGAPTPAPNAAPVPTPATPPPPTPTPQYVMTEKANGCTREQLINSGQGWTDELLIEQGMMLPPGGVKPSFQ